MSGNGNRKKAGNGKGAFVPVNDLEKKLARIDTGRTTFLKAFTFLMNSMVVVLVKPGGESAEGKGKQLILRGPEGKPVLAMFSSSQRSVVIQARHASYTQAVTMPGWHAVSSLPASRGLVVNPGSPVGFTVMPEELQKLRKKFRLGGSAQ